MSDRIQRTRVQCGLTLRQAARLLVMPEIELAAIEQGTIAPADAVLAAMAALYRCSVAWLRGETAELSAENQALLRDIEHTGDRATVREFMQMLSTGDSGTPAPSARERLAAVRRRKVTERAWDASPNDRLTQEESDWMADNE